MDPIFLLLASACGLLGLAMFLYGKKARRLACLTAGLALMMCPYVVPGTLGILIVGGALTATPVVWKA